MKDKTTALYAIAFILIGGLFTSPSMQLSGIAFAQDDTDEVDEEEIQFEAGYDDSLPPDEVDEEEHDDYDDTRDSDDYKDYDRYKDHKEKADRYCNMSEEEREEHLAKYEDMREYKEKLDEYCQLDESERDQYIEDHKDEIREKYNDKVDYLKDYFEIYCDMSDEERDKFLAMHDKMTDEPREQHDRYCSMTDEEREEFKKENRDKMTDYKKDHMTDKKMSGDFVRDFDMRIASMCDTSTAKMVELMQKYEFFQEHHERIAEYCNMSQEERKDYRMTHQDMMEDYTEDFGQMRDRMMDGLPDMKMKIQEKMRQYDMSDERHEVIQEKFRTMHSDLSDVQRDEIRDKIKAKYMDHFKSGMEMRLGAMPELEKDQILQRHAEMKDYKSELRLKYKDMSEDERVQFQAEFRDKVSDKRFAWISPHKQMLAGVPVDELECREGLNLVLKTSNGKAMCVKSTTAERLIENGIAVPAA